MPSAVAKRLNRGDARRQPSIPDKTWAKPAKVGAADKIAMTKQEIYKSEQSNDKDIILYLEGKFYKAYERSAWR